MDLEAIRQALASAIRSIPSSRLPIQLHLVIPNLWSRAFQVTPPANAQYQSDARAAAALKFEQNYGEPSSGWILSGTMSVSESFAVCAVPRTLHDTLTQTIRDTGRITLVSLLPQTLHELGRTSWQQTPETWHVLSDGQSTSIALLCYGRVSLLSHKRSAINAHTEADDCAQVSVLLQVEVARHGLKPAEAFYWHQWKGSNGFETRRVNSAGSLRAELHGRNSNLELLQDYNFQFCSSRYRPWPWWMVMTIGLLAVITLLGLAYTHQLLMKSPPVRDIQPSIVRTDMANQPVGVAKSPAALTQPTRTLRPDQVTIHNAAVAQLNLPWASVLDEVSEAAFPGIALISLESIGGASRMRLTAESLNFGDLSRFVERIQRSPAIRSAILIKHEIDTTQLNQAIRFSIELSWGKKDDS
jgi:hypothetical protein